MRRFVLCIYRDFKKKCEDRHAAQIPTYTSLGNEMTAHKRDAPRHSVPPRTIPKAVRQLSNCRNNEYYE